MNMADVISAILGGAAEGKQALEREGRNPALGEGPKGRECGGHALSEKFWVCENWSVRPMR
jgi:hypothetical protein